VVHDNETNAPKNDATAQDRSKESYSRDEQDRDREFLERGFGYADERYIHRAEAREISREFSILDGTSFSKITADPAQIAGLYFYYVLDCLVDLAHDLSKDFFARPHLYIDVGGIENAELIANLFAGYGNSPFLLGRLHREAIYRPLFGNEYDKGDEEGSNFSKFRDDLLDASAAFAERVYDTGEDMLRERVRIAHRSFKRYLEGLHGDALKWPKERGMPLLTEQIAYRILRIRGVVTVFGQSTPPGKQWPYTEDVFGNKLVEELARHFNYSSGQRLTRERFSNLQRTALRGTEALAFILYYDESLNDAYTDALITKCYTWAAALNGLGQHNKQANATGVSTRPQNRSLLPISSSRA
jgi:hypothetical protein